MCARHWRMVPKPVQEAIYESHRSGNRPVWRENSFEAVRVVDAMEGGRAALGLPRGTKALTVWQPWASLIILGAKPWEFRRWNFADRPSLALQIGRRIVVHAGARPIRTSELDDILERIDANDSALDVSIALPFVRALRDSDQRQTLAPLGAALGTAVLGEPRNVVDLFKDTIADSDRLDEHMYGWPMDDVARFAQPIPAAGAQGFWNWS